MKTIIASLTFGACLLSFSTGLALAENPHPFTISGTGQPGTNNGISCNTGTVGPGPGGSVNANGSPFNTNVTKTYAGNTGNPTVSGPGGNGIPVGNAAHAVSQYDVACFQQAP